MRRLCLYTLSLACDNVRFSRTEQGPDLNRTESLEFARARAAAWLLYLADSLRRAKVKKALGT